MKRFFVSELYPHARYTVGIWREDVEHMLAERGYRPIRLPASNGIFSKLASYIAVFVIAFRLPAHSLLFFHFPLRSRLIRFFFQLAKRGGASCVCLVHDLEGLRDEDETRLTNELKWLSGFSVIISQNNIMKAWLENKVSSRVISLGFHDALYGKTGSNSTGKKTNYVCFAGNLEKASFVHKLDNIADVHFHIYGNRDGRKTTANIAYHGVLDPEELCASMSGSFGLVWDGDDIHSCDSRNGRYLLYNTPYKMTAYVIAGLPLIVWKDSAMATWVKAENIGITVGSLYEIKEAIRNVSEQQYAEMKTALAILRQKINQGHFFKAALAQAEAFVSV